MMQMLITEIEFAYRPVLFLLAALPLLALWYFMSFSRRSSDIKYPHSAYRNTKKSIRLRLRHLPSILRFLAIALLILALARPQSTKSTREVTVEGIDIMIALDISGSMLAEDFMPNRMEAAKNTAKSFVEMREEDRIGVSVFSGQSFTLCPLTTDHTMVRELISSAGPGMVEDGTAIGDGLATAVNRLRDSEAESRVIVLLTDGINNTGSIDPVTAAEMADIYGIRVYTIGVGSDGAVPYPFETPFGIQYRDVEIPVDEELLLEIAGITGGEYFWADTPDALAQVYEEIDQLERSVIDHTEYTHTSEEYLPLLLLAMILTVIDTVMRHTWLKKVP